MMKTRALRYTTGNRKKEATTMSTRRMDDLKAAEKMWLKSPDLYEKGHMAIRHLRQAQPTVENADKP